ncbi:MAG: hypothetical protein HYZ18_01310 [Pseudogulbenkiania sp.]|nr:hypothetical protein [Pseudogulbenkiania sp.]
MDIFHETWFWVVVIGAPLVSVIGTLIRLARKEPPIKLPPGVVPQPYRFDDEEDEDAQPGTPPAASEEKGGPEEGKDRAR